MDENSKKWFYLAQGMTALFGAYISSDIIFKMKDLKKQKKKTE